MPKKYSLDKGSNKYIDRPINICKAMSSMYRAVLMVRWFYTYLTMSPQ